jgi:Zn-dependent M16 (insulinase) family peptidase
LAGSFLIVSTNEPNQSFGDRVALDVLWSYLADSAVSPLHQDMVEIEKPYCTDISVEPSDHLIRAQVLPTLQFLLS